MEISHHFRQLVPTLNCSHGKELAPKSSKRDPYCSLWLLLLFPLLCWEEPGFAFSRHPQYWNTVVRFPVSLFKVETQVLQLPFVCHMLHSSSHPSDDLLDLLQFATFVPVLGQPGWTPYTKGTLVSGKWREKITSPYVPAVLLVT